MNKVLIAGGRGMVGSAIHRALHRRGTHHVFAPSHAECDWESREQTFRYLHSTRPDTLFICAARVGGIFDNAANPEEFLAKNLAIGMNLLQAAKEFEVRRVMFFGSSCIYPRDAENPISESALLTGPLERTNEGYALAKIACVKLAQYLGYHSVMPTNLYGPGDNFRNPEKAHVIPALISKLYHAERCGNSCFMLRGTGSALREFLHCDDLADVCLELIQNDSLAGRLVNIGSGEEIAVKTLANQIASLVGFSGTVFWDGDPYWNGTLKKRLDCTLLRSASNWRPKYTLATGLPTAFKSFLEKVTPAP